MASKGKVGGRNKKGSTIVRKCEYCGNETNEVVRVKSYNKKGSSTMIWECKKCLEGK